MSRSCSEHGGGSRFHLRRVGLPAVRRGLPRRQPRCPCGCLCSDTHLLPGPCQEGFFHIPSLQCMLSPKSLLLPLSLIRVTGRVPPFLLDETQMAPSQGHLCWPRFSTFPGAWACFSVRPALLVLCALCHLSASSSSRAGGFGLFTGCQRHPEKCLVQIGT